MFRAKIILKLFYINTLMHPSADTEVDWNFFLTSVVSSRPQSLKLLGFMSHYAHDINVYQMMCNKDEDFKWGHSNSVNEVSGVVCALHQVVA